MKASQLRASILQQAVEGKLVPQIPEEGTAADLLESIRAEREALIKAGKIKKAKPLPKITEDEIPFEIPESWEWVRFGNLYSLTNGVASRGTPNGVSIPVLRLADLSRNKVDTDNVRTILLKEKEIENHLVQKNDLIFIRVNGSRDKVGSAYQFTLDKPMSYCDHLFCGHRYCNLIDVGYIMYFFNCSSTRKQLSPEIKTTAGQNTISQTSMANILIPLPPLAEQKRIVAKLEELMPLIDAYEKEEEKLSALEKSLPEKLRRSVLQQAVEGKLVPQRAEEGTAAELLKEIERERAELVKAGKMKKGKPLPEISEEEIPFEIPESWKWVRLDDICVYIHRGKSPIYSEIKEIPVVAQKCVQWSGVSLELARFINPTSVSRYSDAEYLKTDDILINSTGLGTLGRVGVYNEKVNPYSFTFADSHVTVVRPCKNYISASYVYAWFSGAVVQGTIEDKASGSTKQKELATETIRAHLVPLPPLAEQKRIVAKVEELMRIIDKL